MLEREEWQGVTILQNKIIDNFTLTKTGKLWAREQNIRKGWREEKGRGLKRIRRIHRCFLQGKEKKTLMTPSSILPLSPFSAPRLAARRAKLGAVMSLNCKCFFFISDTHCLLIWQKHMLEGIR